MRSIANTAIAWDLVNIPVKMHGAVESHDVSTHFHHADCLGGISLQRVCKTCSAIVDDVVKGVDVDGQVVAVTADELKCIEPTAGKTLKVLAFVLADEVEPILHETPHFLEPTKEGLEGYALLRTVLSESGRVSVVRYMMRGASHLAVLRVRGDLLLVQNISWPDEIREPAFEILDTPVALKPEAVKAAAQLVDSMTAEFRSEDYVDGYTARLSELVATKAAGGDVSTMTDAQSASVADLIVASIERSKSRHPAGKGQLKVVAS